jgi:hypothetical protein
MRSRALHASVVVLLLATLVGCGTARGTATIRERADNGRRTSDDVPLSRLAADPRFQDLPVMAAFSAAVYVDAPRTRRLSDLKRDGDAAQKVQLALLPEGWVERTDLPQAAIPTRRQTPDLTYRVWVNERHTPPVAVIAFRGTHIRADWFSNLRWVDSWIPSIEDHYEQTERITPELVRFIKSNYGEKTSIIATGHSLGGGLAQTAAYAACGDIATVYAFDSSPVTKHRAVNNCDGARSAQSFYRVFEQSEILSYARFVVRLALGLHEKDPHMMEIKVHLFDGIGVRAHSMQQLAEALNREVK